MKVNSVDPDCLGAATDLLVNTYSAAGGVIQAESIRAPSELI